MTRLSAYRTVLESAQRLRRGHGRAVELFRNLFRLRSLQPHHAHIVHVRDDRGNRAALALHRLRLPRRGRKVVDQVMIDAVVSVERIQ